MIENFRKYLRKLDSRGLIAFYLLCKITTRSLRKRDAGIIIKN
jgi:hypothetical protein